MKVLVYSSRREMDKFRHIVRAFPNIWKGLVLDVGCRSTYLKHVLPNGEAYYCGLDLFPPANVIGNLEAGLPFENGSWDVVVALDVLEHTDNIYRASGELFRVARQYVLVTLPNAYEVKCRLKFLLGRQISGKYGLPLTPPDDRHRWLFSLREARVFTHTMGRRHDFKVVAEGCLTGRGRSFAGGWLIVSLLPNLLSPWYVALLQRKEN